MHNPNLLNTTNLPLQDRFISDEHPHVLGARALMAQHVESVPFLVFDVETTGLRPDLGDKVIEIALQRIQAGCEPVQVSYVLNPGRPVSDEIYTLTGISPEEVVAAKPFADVRAEIRALLEGAVLVAHNAPFDLGFLAAEFAGHGEKPPIQPVIDTLALAKGRFKFPNNKLTTIAGELGLVVRSDAHRAFADVDMTAQVLKVMIERLKEQGHSVDLIQDLMDHTGSELLSVPVISSIMLHDIRAAQQTGKEFIFKYKKAGQRKLQKRRVRITSFDGVYVIGIDLDKGEERQFRVDRISL